MVWEEKIGWKKSIKFIEGNRKTLVANIDNGGSLFVSNECLQIINEAIDENLSFEELLAVIEDAESREYMKQLLYKLYCQRVWNYEGEIIDSSFYQISLDITNECNLRCKHCCISAGENLKGEDLSEQEMEKLVDKIVNLQPKMLTISGGEPLIRRDFKKIVEQIRKKYDGVFTLMTNATLLNEEMAAFIKTHFDAVDVSIDGADEESCAILRGKGVFEKCITGIKLLQAAGVEKISASMVVTKENEYAKEDFSKLCEEMQIGSMMRILDNSGRAGEIYDDIVCEKEVDTRSFEDIERAFQKNKMYQYLPQIYACQGAKIEFQINHRGDIYPCGAMMQEQFCMGNALYEKDLKEYLEKREFQKTDGYKRFEELKPCKIEKCCDCKYNILCFSCVNEIRKEKEKNLLYEECAENKFYYDLYWREYESV